MSLDHSFLEGGIELKTKVLTNAFHSPIVREDIGGKVEKLFIAGDVQKLNLKNRLNIGVWS
jgi:hypothetical protein